MSAFFTLLLPFIGGGHDPARDNVADRNGVLEDAGNAHLSHDLTDYVACRGEKPLANLAHRS